MDLAPLTAAQNTARSANTPEQHEKAAAEYSAAAQDVNDAEALRILSLLEHHHHQLARIVKTHHSAPSASPEPSHKPSLDQPVSSSTSAPLDSTSSSQDPPSSAATATATSSTPSTRRPPSPVLQRRPARDLSSTIATDLAIARGIPSQQRARHASPVASLRGVDSRQSSRQQRQGGPSTPKSGAPVLEDAAQRIITKPEQSTTSTSTSQPHSIQNNPSPKDDAFQKFYSTFEGLLSKLSAPLAFAGLPLGPDEQSQGSHKDKSLTSGRPKPQEVTSDGPDVTKLFSKAALRAVKEDNPGFGGIQESFLVVPTAGGTVSYAGILSRQERHARQHSMEQPLDPDDDVAEHFVDAKSSPQSRSPKASRNSSVSQPRSTNKSLEELELENESLKQLTDNLSRRLYMWEKSAQSQSMALQQSIRTLQPPASHPPQDGSGEQSADSRLKELEEQLAATKKEMQKYERENDKLKTVVARYRERWEKLKEGARVRRGDKTPVPGPQGES